MNNQINSIERLKEFDEFYKKNLKQRLFNDFENEPLCIKKLNERFDAMIDYNVPHGKKLRGLCAYESLILLLNINLNESKCAQIIEEAKAIGWCIEFLQASFLVADDIMDNSTLRRGQPCWYLNKDVGNIAINDSFYLLALVFKIINEFLTKHPMYSKFYEVFSRTFTNTVVGQGLDLITPPKIQADEIFDFSNYTSEQYDSIVKWKTAFYSFCLPIQCALYLANIDNEQVHEKCNAILLEMGNFFQIQDDYLDCYGDPKVTGKVGTDIEESKCGWLVIQALKKSNDEQRSVLEKNYGKTDKESVARIKKLFNDLNLVGEYEQFEKKKFEKIISDINNLNFNDSNQIDQSQTERIKITLENYAKKIFKRNK